MPDGRLLKHLEPDPSDVAEMSETEYRNTILGHEYPINPPIVRAVERSIGRERQKLEDMYEPLSGPEKWADIGDQILPRWAEVMAELDRRRDYSDSNGIELEYKNALSGRLKRARGLKKRLESNPEDYDLVEFLESFRGLEDTYEQEVKPILESKEE